MKVFHRETNLGEIFSKFIESYIDPLIIFEPERFEILYTNEKAKDFLENDSDFSFICRNEEYFNFLKLIRDCYSIEEMRVITFEKKNGKKGILLFSLYPIAYGNRRVVILTFKDITEKIKEKEERRKRMLNLYFKINSNQ